MTALVHLNSIISAIFDFLFGWIIDFVETTIAGLLNLILSFIYNIVFAGLGAIIDASQQIFRIFAGTANAIYTEAGQNIFGTQNIFGSSTGNMLFDFLMSDMIIGIFIRLLILSLFLLVIFTIVAIVKQEWSTDVTKPENNKMAIVAKSGRALMSFIFIPIMCIFGIYASNMLLRAIDQATGGGTTSMGARVFVAASFNANRARTDEQFFNALTGRQSEYNLSNTFDGYFAQGTTSASSSEKAMDVVATRVDAAFLSNAELPGTWTKGDVFGDGIVYNFWGGEANAGTTFDYKNFTVADYYYDMWKFDYVVAIIAGVFLAFLYIKMLVTLAKRIYELILLFLASPVVISMMPLDGGKALGEWRSQFVSKTLMVYGPVVAMNLFISIFGLFTSVDTIDTVVSAFLGMEVDSDSFLTGGGVAAVGPAIAPFLAASFIARTLPGLYTVYNLATILFMCAGVLVVDQTSQWISKWIGAEDAIDSGKKQSGAAKGMILSTASKAVPVLRVAGGAFKGAGKVAKATGKAVVGAPKAIGAGVKGIAAGARNIGGAVSRAWTRGKLKKQLFTNKVNKAWDDYEQGNITYKEYSKTRKEAKEQYKAEKMRFDSMKADYQDMIAGGMGASEAGDAIRERYSITESSIGDNYVKGLERSGRGKAQLQDAKDLMTLGIVSYRKTNRNVAIYDKYHGHDKNTPVRPQPTVQQKAQQKRESKLEKKLKQQFNKEKLQQVRNKEKAEIDKFNKETEEALKQVNEQAKKVSEIVKEEQEKASKMAKKMNKDNSSKS